MGHVHLCLVAGVISYGRRRSVALRWILSLTLFTLYRDVPVWARVQVADRVAVARASLSTAPCNVMCYGRRFNRRHAITHERFYSRGRAGERVGGRKDAALAGRLDAGPIPSNNCCRCIVYFHGSVTKCLFHAARISRVDKFRLVSVSVTSPRTRHHRRRDVI